MIVKDVDNFPVDVYFGVVTLTLTDPGLDVVMKSSSFLLEAEFCPKVMMNSLPRLSGAPS